jgi:hypothetical protein
MEVAQQLIEVGLQNFAEDTGGDRMLEHDSFAGRLTHDISLSFRSLVVVYQRSRGYLAAHGAEGGESAMIRLHSISWGVAAAVPAVPLCRTRSRQGRDAAAVRQRHSPGAGPERPWLTSPAISYSSAAWNITATSELADPRAGHACAAQRRRGNSVVNLISEIATNELTSRMLGNWDSFSKKNF